MSDVDPAASARQELLARWAERDAAIGLAAEVEQLTARLAERDAEVAHLRERVQRQAQRVAQLVVERDRVHAELVAARRPSVARRAYLRGRGLAGRALRAAGLR